MPRAFLVKKRGPKRGSPSMGGGPVPSPNGGSLSPEVGLLPKDANLLHGLGTPPGSGSSPEEARGWKEEVAQDKPSEWSVVNGLEERCAEVKRKTPSPSQSALEEREETETDSPGAPRCTKDRCDAAAAGGPMENSRSRLELTAMEPTPQGTPPPVAAPDPRLTQPCGEISPDAAPEPEVMRFHRSPDAPTSCMTLTPVARSIGYITSSPTKTRCPRITIERTLEGRGTKQSSYHQAPVPYNAAPPSVLPAAPPVDIKRERSPTFHPASSGSFHPTSSGYVSSSGSIPSSSIWAPHRDVGTERDFRSQPTAPPYPEATRRFPSPDLPSPPPPGLGGIRHRPERYSPPGGHPHYDSDIGYGLQHPPGSHLPVSMFDRRHPPPPPPPSHQPALPALRPSGSSLPLNQIPDHTSGLGSSNNTLTMSTSTPVGRNQNFVSPRKRFYPEDSLLREYAPRPLYDPRYHSSSTSSSSMPSSWVGDTQSAPLNMTTIKENNGECRSWRDTEGNGEPARLKPRIPWGIENIPLDNDLDLKSMLPPKKRRENDPPRYQCEACKKSYATHGGLSKHRQFHCISIIKKEFSCKNCDKTYVSLGALKMHIRTHTLPCKCHLCGKAFARPWLLQGHVRTHTGEKPYQCAHCGRSFADRSNLRAHLQTHTDIKKYNCRSCSKSFSRMSLLTKHEDGGCGSVSI